MKVRESEVKHLKQKAVRGMLKGILNQIVVKDLPIRSVRRILRKLIHELDGLDCMDVFGTEGWRHAFGMDEHYECE